MHRSELQVHLNRSYPINSQVEEFQILEHDPRSIDEDLKQVFIESEPRAMFYTWCFMDRKLGIDRSRSMPRFRYLLTTTLEDTHKYPSPERITDVSIRSEAVSGYMEEQKTWKSRWGSDSDYEEWASRLPYPDTPERIRNAPLPAFGFWLLPLVALGEPRDRYGRISQGHRVHPDFVMDWKFEMTVDLQKHRPQLGLFDLPRRHDWADWHQGINVVHGNLWTFKHSLA